MGCLPLLVITGVSFVLRCLGVLVGAVTGLMFGLVLGVLV